jgi:hypothetical protein
MCGDFSFSSYITDWSESGTVDMLDVTVPTSPSHAKAFIPGQTMSTLSLKGLLDLDGTADAQYDQIKDWFEGATSEAVTYGPSGLTLGSEVILSSGLVTKAEISAATTSPVTFSLDVQNSGLLGRGVSLHDLSAETADTSGTGVDGGAASTTGAIAHLHVTAFSGLSSAVVIVEDSANNSTWATIGTFTTVAGLTQERITIAGTVRRYTRYSVDVTGTGSITFAAALART